MSEWLPIDTAPKDGTVVLVFDPTGLRPDFSWGADRDWPESLVTHVLPARYVLDERWPAEQSYWVSIVAEYDFGVSSDPSFDATPKPIDPTHWMPLPEPPLDFAYAVLGGSGTGEMKEITVKDGLVVRDT